ncbi:MAG: ubiG 1 [Geminicoccaceae bacterium]|jgi:SAM-dependent methyltransferase|nr:ubiG 1 [Geminicoccaceae bacterium]
MRELHQECLVCSGAIRNKWQKDGYAIAECVDCGFVFVADRLSDADLAAYYATPVKNPVYNDPDNTANLAFYYERLRKEIESRIAPGRVLDIGCSNGQFLDVMERWERYGTEIGGEAEAAIAKYGERIKPLPIEQCDWPDAFFDVITMQDSFDHMLRPMEVLAKCATLLRPGGLLVIKVHDISSVFARVSGSRYYALIPPSHLSYFSPKTLRRALDRTGFSTVAVKYLPHILFLRTIPFRLSRNDPNSVFYRMFELLSRSRLGKLRVRKNVFDIMTVFATRVSDGRA